MDGNGRWAKQRGRHRVIGHRRGAEVVRNIIDFASSTGLKYLSLFAFSEENWARPKVEVSTLMRILRRFLDSERQSLVERNIKLNVFGSRERLSKSLITTINETEKQTKDNTGLTLNIFLSYGGRQEIVNAVNRILASSVKRVSIDDFKSFLYTADIPDPDLLIRTSGEYRISNFMLWQLAYAEFYTTEVLWPDFTVDDFKKAVQDFLSRDRRYGKVK